MAPQRVALLRKLRGLLGMGLTWGVVWAAVAMAITMVIWIVDPTDIDAGEGPLIAGAIIGLNGFVAGSAFGLLLSFAETRKTILGLSLPRVTIWGLLASAALPLLTGMPVGMLWFGCTLGPACAAATVAGARRAELRAKPLPSRRGLHVVLIALLVGPGLACTSWRTSPTTPDAFSGGDSLVVVRVTLTDSTQFDLRGAHIAQDSLRGMDTQSQRPVTVALSEIELIQTRQVDAAKTVTLVLGLGLAAVIVFFIALAQSFEGL